MGCGAQKGSDYAEISKPDEAAQSDQATSSAPAGRGQLAPAKAESADVIRDFSTVSDGQDLGKLDSDGKLLVTAVADAPAAGAPAAGAPAAGAPAAGAQTQAPASHIPSEDVPAANREFLETVAKDGAVQQTMSSESALSDAPASVAISQPSVANGASDADAMLGVSQPLLVASVSQASEAAPQPATIPSPAQSAAPRAERPKAPAVFLPLSALDEEAAMAEPVSQEPVEQLAANLEQPTAVEETVPAVALEAHKTGWDTPSSSAHQAPQAQQAPPEGGDVLSSSIRDALKQPLLVANFSESIDLQ